MAVSRKPLLIAEVKEDSGLQVNEVNLNQVLAGTKDSCLATISVCGGPNSGKVLLLGYVLRCLEALEDGDADWINRFEKDEPLSGFKLKNGKKPDKPGMWIWNKAFRVRVEEDDDFVSVLLLYFNGPFDDRLEINGALSLSGLALNLSSNLVFNCSTEIKESFLGTLSNYISWVKANCVKQAISRTKYFFLVRDWVKPSQYPYGSKGGRKYLEEKLKTSPRHNAVQRAAREIFNSTLKKVDCFLLPFPGEAALEKDFNGAVAELSKTFALNLEQFIDILTNPKELSNGWVTTADEFRKQVIACAKNVNAELDEAGASNVKSPGSVKSMKSNEDDRNSCSGLTFVSDFEDLDWEKEIQKAFGGEKKLDKSPASSEHNLGPPKANRGTVTPERPKKSVDSTSSTSETPPLSKSKKTPSIKPEAKPKSTPSPKPAPSKFNIEAEMNSSEETFQKELSRMFPLDPFKPDFYPSSEINEKGNALLTRIKNEFKSKGPETSKVYKLDSKLFDNLNNFIKENEARQKQAEQALSDIYLKSVSNFEKKMASNEVQKIANNPIAFKQFCSELIDENLKDYSYERKQILGQRRENVSHLDLPTSSQLLSKFNQLIEEKEALIQDSKAELTRKTNDLIDDLVEKYRKEVELVMSTSKFVRRDTYKIMCEFDDNCLLQRTSADFLKCRDSLQNKLSVAYDEVTKTVKEKVQTKTEKINQALQQSVNIYQEEMQGHLKQINDKSSEAFQKLHETCLALAIENLEGREPNCGKEIKSKLMATIEDERVKIRTDFLSKQKQESTQIDKVLMSCLEQYESKMKQKMEIVKDLKSLERSHREKLAEAKFEFEKKCKNSTEKMRVNQLEAEIEKAFKKIKERMELKLGARKATTSRDILEITKMYDADMAKVVCKTEFVDPKELERLHKTALEKCKNELKRRSPGSASDEIAELEAALKVSFARVVEANDMNLDTDEVAIGIDLGTTYSCVAVYRKGNVEVIPNSIGKTTTPSYVQFRENGKIVVGDEAKRTAYEGENPENTIFDAKRILGRKITDKKLQNDMKMWPFQVQEEYGIPKLSVRGKLLYPEQVSAEVLKEMKQIAEKHLKKEVRKAVITVPAYFTDGQRQATADAGTLAGLNVLSVLTEPVAAAMAYKKQNADMFSEKIGERHILIFDLGGGTFDVVVLKSSKGEMEVLAIGGDDHLGGEDFDESLMEYCAGEFKRKEGVDLLEQTKSSTKRTRDTALRSLKRLKMECEQTKIGLTSSKQVKVSIDVFHSRKDLEVVISREKFEELNKMHFQNTIDIVVKTLQDAKLAKGQIDDIVLVGGSTRIPKIQELLKSFFDGKELDNSINPDEAVAWGAAMKAAQLNGAVAKGTLVDVKDATPMSIGVEVYGGAFSVIIPKGTKIPVKAQEVYRTAHNNQTSVQITIFQGEKEKASENVHLGDFYLNGIPPKDAEAEKIEVEMVINSDGILHVSAKASSGEKSSVTVTENKQRMSKDLINKLLRAA